MKFGGWQRCSLLDYPGKISAVLFTKGCPFRCPFCHNPDLVLPGRGSASAPSTEEIVAFLEKRTQTLEGVVISGGEPTIHQDLPDFLHTVRRMGFSIKLDTNGSSPEMISLLLSERLVDYWAIDRKASLARYPLLTGVPIDPSIIEQSSRLIMASSCDYEFRTTVIREWHSREEVTTIGAELCGARRLFLQRFCPTTTLDPQFGTATAYSAQEMDELCALVRPYVSDCSWR